MPGHRVPVGVAPAVWATFLAELWRWAAEHGDARVPTLAVTEVGDEKFLLGSRVKNARVYYHRGSLTTEQIGQLEVLPGWSWCGYGAFSAAVWRDRTTALQAYAAEHWSVARLHQLDPSLGRWLQTQRRRRLTPVPQAELAEISRALDSPAFFLKEFLYDFDRWMAAVPGRDARHLTHSSSVQVDGRRVQLGARSAGWRRRRRRGDLPPEHIARLEAVPGWEWEPPRGTALPGYQTAVEGLTADAHTHVRCSVSPPGVAPRPRRGPLADVDIDANRCGSEPHPRSRWLRLRLRLRLRVSAERRVLQVELGRGEALQLPDAATRCRIWLATCRSTASA